MISASKIMASSTELVTTEHGSSSVSDRIDESGRTQPVSNLFCPEPDGKKTTVNKRTIMSHSGFNRSHTLITDKMMTTPAYVNRRLMHNIYRADCTHPLHDLVHKVACGRQSGDMISAGWWRKTMASIAMLCGNSVSFINRDRNGVAQELVILPPDSVYLFYQDMGAGVDIKGDQIIKRQKFYCVATRKGIVKIRPENVFHIMNNCEGDPSWAPSLIQQLKDPAGVGMSAARHMVSFYDKGMNVSGILMIPGHINFETEEEKEEVVEKFREGYSGLSNSNKTMVLEEGWKYMQTSMDNKGAQTIEMRKYSNSEVALFNRVSPGLAGGDEPYSYDTAEKLRLSIRENTTDFWFCQYQDQYDLKVLNTEECRIGEAKVLFDRDSGTLLPFADKVAGYSELYKSNAITRATLLQHFDAPISREDNVYFDGTPGPVDFDGTQPRTLPAPAPLRITQEPEDDPESLAEKLEEPKEEVVIEEVVPESLVEKSREAYIESIVRGRSRILGELDSAKSNPKNLYGFFDRREKIAETFERTIESSREVYQAASGKTSVYDLPARVINDVEKIIDTMTADNYNAEVVEAIVLKFKSEEIEV